MNIKQVQIENYQNHSMFYNMMPANVLTPVCVLTQSVKQVNTYLKQFGKSIVCWPNYARNEASRLMWVNWIYRNLLVEPIRKPLLVHQQNDQYIVDCGDTRLMAATLYDHKYVLPVLITCLNTQEYLYHDWIRIYTNQQLFEILGFDPTHAVLMVRENPKDSDHLFSWMEISDQSTSHHWHDENLRCQVLQNYLNNKPNTFKFSVEWALENINWYELR
jgi:hypothetical protein